MKTIVEVIEEAPRAYTAEEVRQQIVDEIIDIVDFAHMELEDEECIGDFIATGILDILSGENPCGLPQFDLVIKYPEEFKKDDLAEGFNFYQDGMVIETVDLTGMYFEEMKALAES